jgi:hypothetical protein
LGAWKEHIGNKGNMKKSSLPPPPNPKLKRTKKQGTLSACCAFHWLHEISIFKTVCHHFWPGLIPPS